MNYLASSKLLTHVYVHFNCKNGNTRHSRKFVVWDSFLNLLVNKGVGCLTVIFHCSLERYFLCEYFFFEIAGKLYNNQETIEERHRHRYEVDKAFVPELEKAGLRFVAEDETHERLEILELSGTYVI